MICIPIERFVKVLTEQVPEGYSIGPSGRLAGCLEIRSPKGFIAASIPFAQFGQEPLIMWFDPKDRERIAALERQKHDDAV